MNEVRSLGVPIYPMVFPAWRKLTHFYKRLPALRKLSKLLQEIQPAILHVNDMYWVPQAILAAKRSNVPVVSTIRQHLHPIRVHQYQLNRVERIITVCEKAHDLLMKQGVLPERARIIPTGIDIDRWRLNGIARRPRVYWNSPRRLLSSGPREMSWKLRGMTFCSPRLRTWQSPIPMPAYCLSGRDTSLFGEQCMP